MAHNLGIMNQEATIKIDMLEPSGIVVSYCLFVHVCSYCYHLITCYWKHTNIYHVKIGISKIARYHKCIL